VGVCVDAHVNICEDTQEAARLRRQGGMVDEDDSTWTRQACASTSACALASPTSSRASSRPGMVKSNGEVQDASCHVMCSMLYVMCSMLYVMTMRLLNDPPLSTDCLLNHPTYCLLNDPTLHV